MKDIGQRHWKQFCICLLSSVGPPPWLFSPLKAKYFFWLVFASCATQKRHSINCNWIAGWKEKSLHERMNEKHGTYCCYSLWRIRGMMWLTQSREEKGGKSGSITVTSGANCGREHKGIHSELHLSFTGASWAWGSLHTRIRSHNQETWIGSRALHALALPSCHIPVDFKNHLNL